LGNPLILKISHHAEIFFKNLHGTLKIQHGHRIINRAFFIDRKLFSAVFQAVHKQFAIKSLFVRAMTALSVCGINKLHPLVALRAELATHSFRKNHLPLDKTRGALDILLGFKHLMQNKKQALTISESTYNRPPRKLNPRLVIDYTANQCHS
jgi:hypothetical protein